MALSRVEWALLILVILKIVTSTSGETCDKINTCSCKFSNGSTVDLKPVDGGSKGPSFTKIPGQAGSGRTFQWNPCTPFSAGSGCKEVMVCQIVGNNLPAGSEDSSFSVDSEGNVVISYGGTKGSDLKTRKSSITLKCDKNEEGKGTIPRFTEPSELLYTATFTSKYACPTGGSSSSSSSSGGLSVGSVLLIIFFPLLLMYVIIGVLINRYGRGIQSMPELLPNHSFWADFPYLVKDGLVFTCGCIKSGCSSLYQKCSRDAYAEI